MYITTPLCICKSGVELVRGCQCQCNKSYVMISVIYSCQLCDTSRDQAMPRTSQRKVEMYGKEEPQNYPVIRGFVKF